MATSKKGKKAAAAPGTDNPQGVITKEIVDQAAAAITGARIYNAGESFAHEAGGTLYALPHGESRLGYGAADHLVGAGYNQSGVVSKRGVVRLFEEDHEMAPKNQVLKDFAHNAWTNFQARNANNRSGALTNRPSRR